MQKMSMCIARHKQDEEKMLTSLIFISHILYCKYLMSLYKPFQQDEKKNVSSREVQIGMAGDISMVGC